MSVVWWHLKITCSYVITLQTKGFAWLISMCHEYCIIYFFFSIVS